MKKVYVIFIYIALTLFFSIKANALNITQQFDEVFSLVQKGEMRNEDDMPYSSPKKIKDTPHKLKYCKLKDGTTFTVLRHQVCKYWDKDSVKNRSSKNKLSVIRGKTIKKNEYLNLNSDFSEKTNLVCIMRMGHYKYGGRFLIAYITHTSSNNVYLNSLVNVRLDAFKGYAGSNDEYKLYGDDVKEKKKWRHQGTSTKEQDKYLLTFYKYLDKDIPYPYTSGPPTLTLNPNNVEYDEHERCFADDKYWLAMYPNKGKEKTKEEKPVVVEAPVEENLTIEPFSKPEF